MSLNHHGLMDLKFCSNPQIPIKYSMQWTFMKKKNISSSATNLCQRWTLICKRISDTRCPLTLTTYTICPFSLLLRRSSSGIKNKVRSSSWKIAKLTLMRNHLQYLTNIITIMSMNSYLQQLQQIVRY